MLVAFIVSFTALATTDDTGYMPAIEVADEHVPSNLEASTEFMLDDEQASVSEVCGPGVPASEESALDDLNAESSDSNSYAQDDPSYTGSTSDPEDDYADDHYDHCELDEYNECVCTYDYNYGDDCNCECFHCKCCYIEIEAYIDFVVANLATLNHVFNNLMTTDGPYTVDVIGSFTMHTQLNIPAGRTVYLSGGALYAFVSNHRHFTVEGTLILNGITLRGMGAATYRGGILVNGGELIMNAGSVIEGNRALFGGGVQLADGAVFTMNGGTISNNTAFVAAWSPWGSSTGGGGIWTECSTLIMDGGAVKNNVVINEGGGLSATFGGGIGGGSNFGTGFESTFVMNGGTISGNVAWQGGGVRLFNANVTINDGNISGNGAIRRVGMGDGGGLELRLSSLTMNGGAIVGNEAMYGGGVHLDESTFVMSGGLIIGNETSRSGAGISVRGSIFTMNNGTISDNEAQSRGGGVSVDVFGEFTMNGGVISNNTASRLEGGGVNVNFDSIFTMTGGTIIDNTAGTNGGGVRTTNNNTFTMSDGIIGNNTAGANGGGVFVDGISDVLTRNTFIMSGGTIDGNIAHENGGGIYLDRWHWWQSNYRYGMFVMTGGAVTNNTAETGNGGGIFSIAHESYPNPLTATAYHNITFESGIISGNTAGTGRYALPTNYYEHPIGHLLNNHEINFRGSYRVETITFDLNGGNVDGNANDVELMLAYGAQIGIANIPLVELFGYSLIGWLIGDEVLTLAELAEKVVDAPMTLIAQWEEIVQTPPDYEYRTIRIYYYLEGYGLLINDTINNAIGREYIRSAGSTFSLAHVVDRNELESDNEYVFNGWHIYVDDVRNNSYISSKNIDQLRGSFRVPASLNDNAASISLVAVWSIYDAQECDDGENGENSNDNVDNNEDTTASPSVNDNQKRLPQTGIESSVLLWSAILALVLLIGISIGVKIRNYKMIR